MILDGCVREQTVPWRDRHWWTFYEPSRSKVFQCLHRREMGKFLFEVVSWLPHRSMRSLTARIYTRVPQYTRAHTTNSQQEKYNDVHKTVFTAAGVFDHVWRSWGGRQEFIWSCSGPRGVYYTFDTVCLSTEAPPRERDHAPPAEAVLRSRGVLPLPVLLLSGYEGRGLCRC